MTTQQFGQLVTALREIRSLSIEQLSELTHPDHHDSTTRRLPVSIILQIEEGILDDVKPSLHLAPLVRGLGLDEHEANELYKAAGFSFPRPRLLEFDEESVTSLSDQLGYAFGVYSPLGDLIAFNSYYRAIYEISDDVLNFWINNELGLNVLLCYFDPIFEPEKRFGGFSEWEKHTILSLKTFRAFSLRYTNTERYNHIVDTMQSTYKEFRRLWRQLESIDLGLIEPFITIYHSVYGKLSFLKSEIPQEYLGSDIHIFGHFPMLNTIKTYMKLVDSVEPQLYYYGDFVESTLPKNRLVASNHLNGYNPVMERNKPNIIADTVEFADEQTRKSWELRQQISQILAEYPPEGVELNTKPITFAPEYRYLGSRAILSIGTVIATGQKNVILAPQRSLDILTELGIPYKVVSLDRLNSKQH